MNHSIIWNNVRFLRHNKALTILKFLVLISGQLYLNVYFFFLMDLDYSGAHELSLSLSPKNVSLMLIISLITILTYLILVFYSGKLRSKEVFMRKWFGESSGRIFWNLYSEHLLIVGTSMIISLIAFDAIIPVLRNYMINDAFLQAIRKLSYYPIVVNSLLVLIFLIPKIVMDSNNDRNKVLKKIYL